MFIASLLCWKFCFKTNYLNEWLKNCKKKLKSLSKDTKIIIFKLNKQMWWKTWWNEAAHTHILLDIRCNIFLLATKYKNTMWTLISICGICCSLLAYLWTYANMWDHIIHFAIKYEIQEIWLIMVKNGLERETVIKGFFSSLLEEIRRSLTFGASCFLWCDL